MLSEIFKYAMEFDEHNLARLIEEQRVRVGNGFFNCLQAIPTTGEVNRMSWQQAMGYQAFIDTVDIYFLNAEAKEKNANNSSGYCIQN